MRVFTYSITYVTLLFAALTVDVLVQLIGVRFPPRRAETDNVPAGTTRPSSPPRPPMSTTDIAPDRPSATDDARRRGAGASSADRRRRVVTSSDSQGRSAGCSSAVAAARCSPWPVVGVILGVERIDGDGAARRRRPAAAVRRPTASASSTASCPLLLGVAVAIVPLQVGARSLAFPRLAAAGFWAWLGGHRARHRRPRQQRRSGRRRRRHGRPVPRRHVASSLVGSPPRRSTVAATVLTTRAPGMRMSRVPFFAWSALVGSIGLLLVLPVAVGVAHLPVRRPPLRRRSFGGNGSRRSWIGFALPSRSTASPPPSPSASSPSSSRHVPPRSRMRGVAYAGIGLIGVAALAGVTQQDVSPCPWPAAASTSTTSATSSATSPSGRCSRCCPILGVVIVMGVGALRRQAPARRPRRSGRTHGARSCSASSASAMVFVGMLGGGAHPIDDLGLQGTVFEEGASVVRRYGAVLAGLGAAAYWARRSGPAARCPRSGVGLALLGVLATVLASLPYFIAGFADQPAASATYDYDGPGELWNVLVAAGHALMALVVLAFVGLVRQGGAGDAAGDDPWGGQTLEWATTSPAPVDNFAEVPTVMSPEPLLDLKASPEPTDREVRPLMHALPPAPRPAAPPPGLVGTALACVGRLMLIGGMLAVWILLREDARRRRAVGAPEDVTIPEVRPT